MHSFNGFTGFEKFCDGMEDDLISGPRGRIKINGQWAMRPSLVAVEIKRSCAAITGGLKLKNLKARGMKFRLKRHAQFILGNQHSSDNERELAEYCMARLGL